MIFPYSLLTTSKLLVAGVSRDGWNIKEKRKLLCHRGLSIDDSCGISFFICGRCRTPNDDNVPLYFIRACRL